MPVLMTPFPFRGSNCHKNPKTVRKQTDACIYFERLYFKYCTTYFIMLKRDRYIIRGVGFTYMPNIMKIGLLK